MGPIELMPLSAIRKQFEGDISYVILLFIHIFFSCLYCRLSLLIALVYSECHWTTSHYTRAIAAIAQSAPLRKERWLLSSHNFCYQHWFNFSLCDAISSEYSPPFQKKTENKTKKKQQISLLIVISTPPQKRQWTTWWMGYEMSSSHGASR